MNDAEGLGMTGEQWDRWGDTVLAIESVWARLPDGSSVPPTFEYHADRDVLMATYELPSGTFGDSMDEPWPEPEDDDDDRFSLALEFWENSLLKRIDHEVHRFRSRYPTRGGGAT
jgi:hypothetical protein